MPSVPALIYPAPAAVVLALAGAPFALIVALAWPGLWPLGAAWTLFVLLLALVDAVLAVDAGVLTAQVELPTTLNVGATGRIAIVTAATPRRLQGVFGLDPRLVLDAGSVPIDLSDGRAECELTATRRGTAVVDALWLRWQGPLGLAWKQRRLDLKREIAILPDIRPVQQDGIVAFARETLDGLAARRERGQGGEFDALTDYQPGMDRRAIDWKHSARHATLLAKEFRAERNNNVVFAVDAGRTMCEPVDGVARVDRAVSAALLGAYAALHAGDRVALFGFDARPRVASGMVAGPGAFAAFQGLVARLDYSSEETNFTVALSTLAGRLDRRSLVVLFTHVVDAVGAELMLRMVGPLAQRHLLIFVLMADADLERIVEAEPVASDDVVRAATAAALLRERRVVIERLRRMGVRVVEAPHDQIGPQLLKTYLDVKQRELL